MSENKDLETRIKQIFNDTEFYRPEYEKKHVSSAVKSRIIEDINLQYDLILELKRRYKLLNKSYSKCYKEKLNQILNRCTPFYKFLNEQDIKIDYKENQYASFLKNYYLKPIENETLLDIEIREAACFMAAYEGIGRILVDGKKFSQAIPYLEKTEFLIGSLKPILNLFDPEGPYRMQILNPIENRLMSYLAKAYKYTNNPKFLNSLEEVEEKINKKIQDINNSLDKNYKFWEPMNDIIQLTDNLSESTGLFNLIHPRTFKAYFDVNFYNTFSESLLKIDNYLPKMLESFETISDVQPEGVIKYQKRLENLVSNLNIEKLLMAYDPVFKRNIGDFIGEGFIKYLNSLFTTLAFQLLAVGKTLSNENLKEKALSILEGMKEKQNSKQNLFFLSSAYKVLGQYQKAEEVNKESLKNILKAIEIFKEYKTHFKDKPNLLLHASNAYLIKFETETSDIYKDFLIQKFLFYDCGFKKISVPECYLNNFKEKNWIMQRLELNFEPGLETHGNIVSYYPLVKNASLEEKLDYVKKAIGALADIQNKADPNLEKLKKYAIKFEKPNFKIIANEKIIKRLKPKNEKGLEDALQFLIDKVDNQEKCFSHGDYHLGNILKIDNDSLVVIDFERANILPTLYDLAFLLEQKELSDLDTGYKKELIKYFFDKKMIKTNSEKLKNYDYMSIFINLRHASISSRLSNSSSDKYHKEDVQTYVKKAYNLIDKMMSYTQGEEYKGLNNLKRALINSCILK